MSYPLVECPYCRELIPDFELSEEARSAVFDRIENATRTHSALEVCYWTKCTKEEAEKYLNHLENCLFSWPYEEDEIEVLKAIDEAFLGVEKPTRAGSCDCEECLECEETLNSTHVQGFKRCWSGRGMMPYCISLPDAIKYWMPAIARCGIEIKSLEAAGWETASANWVARSLKLPLNSQQQTAVQSYVKRFGHLLY